MAAALVLCQAVPQPRDQHVEEFVHRVDGIECRQFSTPQPLDRFHRRGVHNGRGDVAEKPGPHLAWNGVGQL